MKTTKVDKISKTEAQMFNIVDNFIGFQQLFQETKNIFAIIKKKLKRWTV